MENVKKVKSFKMFTKEELSILTPYIKGQEKFTTKVCDVLSQQLGRSYSSLYQYVYRKRNQNKTSKSTEAKKTTVDNTVKREKVTANNTPMFKHGEFIIPVSSWEVRNTNGTTSLVLKFEKSI